MTPLDNLRFIIQQKIGKHMEIAHARWMTSGTVNRTWLVELTDGERVVVRIGPGEVKAAAGPSWLTSFGLRREQAAIRLMQPTLAILPITLAHDFSRADFDGDWVVQRVMPGQAWATVIPMVEEAARRDLWRQLGRLVHMIHAVEGEAFGPPAFGPALPTWPDLVRDDLAGLIADAHRCGLSTQSLDELRDLADRHEADLATVRPRLIHSDLSLDHVFVDENDQRWSISGMIDLEFARFADPISEGLLLDMLDRTDDDATAFFAGYGGRPEVSPVRIEVARALNRAWQLTDAARFP